MEVVSRTKVCSKTLAILICTCRAQWVQEDHYAPHIKQAMLDEQWSCVCKIIAVCHQT